MPSLVTVVIGPAACGKTDRLLALYRTVLATAAPGRTLWLAPSSRAAADIRNRLLEGALDACFAPGISTFARFVETILQSSLVVPPSGGTPESGTTSSQRRPLGSLLKRHLLRQVIDEAAAQGRLNHFGPIASTSGLLDLVCEFISQMKRLEIWPEEFAEACRQRGVFQKDRELLGIYSDYQQQLLDHNLYDAEGCYWSARDWLHRRPIAHQLVVADGFSDFTRTEHDILQDLAAHSEETWISLPMEGDEEGERKAECESGRDELFRKPRQTLAELQKRHANLRVETVSRPASPIWPVITHLERTVFSSPRALTPASDTVGLEILAGGRQIGEIELVGRRIKRLLVDGEREFGSRDGGLEKRSHATSQSPPSRPIRPGEIAVVFRRAEPLAELVSEVFQRLEIPFCLENGRLLVRCPAIVMLLRLLELDADDWPMYKLLGVLGNNYFDPDWTDWDLHIAAQAERAIRGLQIPRGRQRILEALEKARQQPTRPEGPQGLGGNAESARSPSGPSNLAQVHRLLRHLAEALDDLPRYDTLASHVQAWTRLADRVGILRSMRDDADRAAWDRLHETWQESQQLAAWLGRDAARLDRAQAREALLDLVRNEQVGGVGEDWGRVRVLSAGAARHVRIPYLFLAGLSEKSFPAADREDTLYSEAEHQRLVGAGLPLPCRGDRQSDEMLLFYQTIASATRRLWLSYPSIDESGEPLIPSPYVKEVVQCVGTTPISTFQQVDLSPAPDTSELCSIEGFRVRAVAEAVQGKADLLAGLASHCSTAQCILSGLEFSLLRRDRDRFTPAEGMLGKAAIGRIEADFPPARIFSATELERYSYCPYQFFLAKVLNVQPLDELELEIDYAQRGQAAHEVLATFHRRVNQACGKAESPTALAPADFERLLDEALAETFSRPARDSLADAFREIDRRILGEWFQDYRQQHEAYDAQWKDCDRPPRPALFEVSFGQPLRKGDGPPSTVQPLELTGGGQAVRLAGRIDRIDVGEIRGHVVFNILDYKTGGAVRFSLEACQRGAALQLPLYALAVDELILSDRDAIPWQAGYWHISGDGFKPRQALRMYQQVGDHVSPSETWEAIRGILADTVVGLVRAMRRGQFPVWSDDPDCTSRCPYKTVCRINQIRSLEKTWRVPM